ncbi:MAG: succinylglutamate desuccinylase/aspartoacylase family protein [Verrucomicrobiales bacterium]
MSSSKSNPSNDRRDITIGGTAFEVGKKGVVELPIGSLINYQPVSMPVHVRRGKKDGPCLIVTAGLHGDEINGIEIVRRLLRSRLLSGLMGDLILVPIINIPGYLSRSRYLPDRRDLNRLFPGSPKGSLGGRIAYTFSDEVMKHGTHAIDMHTGAIRRPNLPQIRYTEGDETGFGMAKAFAPPVVMSSALRESSLRATYFEKKIPSIIYEAGEAHRLNAASVRFGFRGVISVMRHLGMLPPSKKPQKRHIKTIVAPTSFWVRAPQGGIFSPSTNLGQATIANKEIGVVADPFGRKEFEILSPSDGIIIGILREATVDEGDALFHIAASQNPEKEEAQIQKSEDHLEHAEEEFPGDIN